MVLQALRSCAFLAAATVLFAGVSSSFFASAVDLTATTCEELASLPTDNLTEDSRLIIRGSVYTCDEVGNGCDIPDDAVSFVRCHAHFTLSEVWLTSNDNWCYTA